ncbi:hypothetical protein RUM43_014696 [Polyplax serrata]|uniref:MAPK regulated corepressor interacting protein 2 n=1 Tax=Polyplax serrata TaxID=468196 RepID=A0AAN8RZC0_POLSC
MYNVSVGPSKIVAKTRRGISQNLESLQNLRKQIELDDGEVMNSPRPIFHTNGKKCNNSKQQEVISPQHEELIRFVSDSWSKVFKELETDSVEDADDFTSSMPANSIMYYEDTEPNAFLENFKPFDLESWWGKRLFHNITKSIP